MLYPERSSICRWHERGEDLSRNASSRVPAAAVEAGGMELLHTVFAAVSNNDMLRLDKTPSHFSPQRAGFHFPLHFTIWT